jgi:NAD(P)-dependent dehydrogenase (short-subunit alcohol dehydrogenase family)
MHMELRGKVGLVTGGTRGIGAACAVELAKRGAKVSLVGRHLDDAAVRVKDGIEAAGGSCLLVAADMSRPSDATRCVRETAEALGGVDVLVHSAGGLVTGGLMDVTPEAWMEGFDVHVHAVYHLCRAAVPGMKQKKEGAIILVSSVAGIRGVKMNIAYQAVKGVLPQLTRALAFELADDNIRVNCVAPGIIRTALHAKMTEEQKRNNLDNRIPLHREGSPEQVASLVLELVANDYLTGQTVTIDGGLTMRIA